ncbi:MAG: hypothetical protein V1837_00785 [Candidatus Woesearchaeota archaeon]
MILCKEVSAIKKGQLTIFIILGLAILSSLALVYFLESAKTQILPEHPIEPELVPELVSQAVSSCVKEKAPILIKSLASGGGDFHPLQHRLYQGVNYSYLCLSSEKNGCINGLLTRSKMQSRLAEALRTGLLSCINLTFLKRQGYAVTDKPIVVSSVIAFDHVQFLVDYPVLVSKDSFVLENPKQSVDIALPLGKLLDLSRFILNSEINSSYFDKDSWMLSHPDVLIEKHKPYPDTLYSLSVYLPDTKDSLRFNFGFQGKDTVSLIGKASIPIEPAGYCITSDRACFFNSPQADCISENGVWSSSLPLDCDQPFAPSACKDCSGCAPLPNGASWCVYQGPSGSGLDFVGSQHYLQSCFDGRILTEECRDYREELCSEQLIDGLPKAACRPNRWQDCAAQNIQSSCEDISKRDCQWSAWLLRSPTFGVIRPDHLCSPLAPPGFRHWQNQASPVCGMASEQRSCDGFSCPQAWVDSVAAYCSYQGDCGDYYNIAGAFGSGGYFNTDGSPRLSTLPSAKSANMTFASLQLPLSVAQPILTGHEFDSRIPVQKLMDGISSYMTWLSNQDPSDYAWHYLKYGNIEFHVLHSAFCLPWVAPFGSANCFDCNKSGLPCTEYKCRSLGQGCIYEEKNGFGSCSPIAEDSNPPKIVFDSVKGYNSTRQDFAGYDNCWHLDKPVPPYETINFRFNTSKDASCKTAPLPINYSLIPGSGAVAFSTVHQMSFKVVALEQMKHQFLSAIGLRSVLQVAMLDQYKQIFNKTRSKLIKLASSFGLKATPIVSFIDRLESEFYSLVQPSIVHSLALVERIVLAIEARQGVVFVSCVDRSANNNNFCISYDLLPDTSPPKILSLNPLNNSPVSSKFNLSIVVDEPAQCSYSFDQDLPFQSMPHQLNCTSSELAGFVDNFSCGAEIQSHPQTNIFIRCVDQPVFTESYSLFLTRHDRFAILNQDYPNSISLKQQNVINVTNPFVLKTLTTDVEVNTSVVQLVIYFDGERSCRFSTKDLSFEKTEGIALCELDSCVFLADVPSDMRLFIKCQLKQSLTRNSNPKGYLAAYHS